MMNSDAVFWVGVFVCIILFAGDPDIADGIICYLQNCEVASE